MRFDLTTKLLILALVGFVCWRETVDGVLEKQEASLSEQVIHLSGKSKDIPKVRLVYSNIGGELTPLDCALFLRAAKRLGFETAGIVALNLDEKDDGIAIFQNLLKDVERLPKRVIFSTSLTALPEANIGISPMTIEMESDLPLPTFESASSPFGTSENARAGFINFPFKIEDAALLARVGGRVVPSFALAAILDSEKITIEDKFLKINGNNIPIREGGVTKLDPFALSKISRLELDELLLQAEKVAQGLDANPALLGDKNEILILGAIAPDSIAGDYRLEPSKGLSLAEYQASAIVSITNWLSLLSLGLIGVLIAFDFAAVACFLRQRRARLLLLWLLLILIAYAGTFFGVLIFYSRVLPILPFAAMFIIAALLPPSKPSPRRGRTSGPKPPSNRSSAIDLEHWNRPSESRLRSEHPHD